MIIINIISFVKHINKHFGEGNEHQIEQSFVRYYLEQNELPYHKNSLLTEYLDDLSEDIYQKIAVIITEKKIELHIDTFVTIFETLLNPSDKKSNGMVYTPKKVKEHIYHQLLKGKKREEIERATFCDPACGCGSFFATLILYLHENYGISVKHIVEKQMFGVDIFQHNINKTKILLSIIALAYNEILDEDSFNLKQGNSLDFDFLSQFKVDGFDFIVGNPPYVRTKHIEDSLKPSLEKWRTTSIGNTDLYIPFFELALKYIKSGGKIGYISSNGYIEGLNGKNLRSLFSDNEFQVQITDFKNFQVFEGVTTYTCITIIDTENLSNQLSYSHAPDLENMDDLEFSHFRFDSLDSQRGWVLGKSDDIDFINRVENKGVALGEKYSIRNGLATLADKIFIFEPIEETDKTYIRIHNGKRYSIEKLLCMPIVKCSRLKNKEQLNENKRVVIYPYKRIKNKYKVYPHLELKEKFPLAYTFLTDVKPSLENRDKGKGDYPEWYAFGRTQGLDNFGAKLLVPGMAGQPIFVESEHEELLYYSGLGIFVKDRDERIVLSKLLSSDVFWKYVNITGKHYTGGYISFSKRHIKNFGIPDLSKKIFREILLEEDRFKINEIVKNIYKD